MIVMIFDIYVTIVRVIDDIENDDDHGGGGDGDDSVDCISETSFGTNLIGGKPHRQQIGFSYKYKSKYKSE